MPQSQTPTNKQHRDEETQNTDTHRKLKIELSNQLSLPQPDDCQTRKETQTRTKHKNLYTQCKQNNAMNQNNSIMYWERTAAEAVGKREGWLLG